MNLKTLLISTLIVVIAYTRCTDARRLSTSHRTSSLNRQHKRGSEHHSSANSYPKQKASKQKNLGNIANSPTDTLHGRNQPVANPRISNQPVYIVNSQQQNTHSSGNDDFIAGYVVGSAVAHRKRRRKTTTIAPITTKTPCLNEASMPNNNLLQQQNNPEAVSLPCAAISPAAESPIILNINADNTQAPGNAVSPAIRRKRRRKTTTVVPITEGPMPYINLPQQQHPGDNFESRKTEISTASPGNTNVNANNILFK